MESTRGLFSGAIVFSTIVSACCFSGIMIADPGEEPPIRPPEPPQAPASTTAKVVSIKPEEIVEYPKMRPEVQKLVRESLKLTALGLGYTYGSNNPENKGMDCSGTVQRALKAAGVKNPPRSSYTIYQWAGAAGNIRLARGVESLEDEAFQKLKPGDLLFWEGTYATAKRKPPISHVMIYLGTWKKDGKPVIFGASSGRRFRGKKIHGVSVFDFALPRKESKAKFVGYGPV
ncbi:MAG: hypothetical protein HKN23_22050, partial [Verrucomicrobiales bacterium]|nr:hypothetical protein [Verrucomicrobiales bacterium]